MTGLFPFDVLLLCLALSGPDTLDDRDLTRRIKRGDADAFKTFFDRYHGLLFRYLRRRGVAGAVSEDIIQQAFLTLWERRAHLDEHRSIRSFLFTIGHNRALNHFRDTARFADEMPVQDPVAPSMPDAQAEHSLMQQALRAAVEALPERRRAVFELCFLQGLTYREAADVLTVSVKTVENQMGHALKAVRKALAVYL